MKVCVYGAGAIGGAIGVALAQKGCEISVVARGATLESIRQKGLRANLGTGEVAVTVRASDDPETLGIQDLLIIGVKSPSLAAVASACSGLIGPQTIILPAMNGVPWWFFSGFGGEYEGTILRSVDPDGHIGACFPGKQVVGCVVHFAASVPEPGYARINSPQKPLIFGEPSGAITERVRSLADLFTSAGFETSVSACIQKDIWYKLWGNMTMNPLSALTGATTDQMIDDPLVKGFCLSVMEEAKSIGEKIGCPIAQSGVERMALTRSLGVIKTSMLQDAEAGKMLELDALVATVREIGATTGVPTPATDALYGLVRLQARIRGLYPWN